MKPKLLEDSIKPVAEKEDPNNSSPALNSPDLDPETGKPRRRAIESFNQAWSISKRLFDRAKDGRLRIAAQIASKYGGESPFTYAALKATGQLWRNNYSTNPLASVVDRSTPQLTDPIKQADYLTYSALPAEVENSAKKTRHFRKRMTQLFRDWPEFQSLIGGIAQDDYLFGNNAPGWIDDDWRPRAFNYDEIYLPEGTKQHAKTAQYVVFRQPVPLHEFLRKIEDREVAEAAGYDWAGCIKAANEASGQRSHGDHTQVEAVDAQRENGSVGYSYDGDTKVIWMMHVLVMEWAGGVNLWTVEQYKGHAIRRVERIHEDMEDAVTFFTLQEGNKTYYGSKGAGRLLGNLHTAIDRGRNLASDKLYLAGLPILRAATKVMSEIQIIVRSPFLMIPLEAEVTNESISFDQEAFQYMDSNLTGQMNQIAGAFIPPHTESDQAGATTKIEAAEKAQRELAVKDGVLGRFFAQFANMVSAMQRKACKPDNIKEAVRIFEDNQAKKKKGIQVIADKVWKWLKDVVGDDQFDQIAPQEASKIADPEAVQMLVDLLTDGLTKEEIIMCALSPAGNSVEDKPEEQDQKTLAFIGSVQAGPLMPYYNASEMARMQSEIAIGEDRTNRLLQPDQPDPNIAAVATRDQIQEWLAMLQAEQQPVCITDNHAIHRQVLLPKLQPIIQTLSVSPTQEISDFAKLGVQHYANHLNMDLETSQAQKDQEAQQVKAWSDVVNQADKALATAAAKAAQVGVRGGAGAVPAPVNGAPPQAAGPNGSMGAPGDPQNLEAAKLNTETLLRVGDQQIQHRKLDIEEQKLQHQQNNAVVTHTADALKTVAQATADAQQRGIEDGHAQAAQQDAALNPNNPTI